MNCMAHGGKLSNPSERGVHHQREDKPDGESNMGTMVRRGDTEMAKRQAIDKKKDQRNSSTGMRPLQGLAKGGEVEEQEMPDHDDIDSELNDMVADEFFEAVEKKDKKGLLDAVRALVMQCGEK